MIRKSHSKSWGRTQKKEETAHAKTLGRNEFDCYRVRVKTIGLQQTKKLLHSKGNHQKMKRQPIRCSESESRSVMSDSLLPHGLSPWNSPGQNTGVDSLSFLQGIFPTQRLNPGLPHCRRILYQLSHKGKIGRASCRERVCLSV